MSTFLSYSSRGNGVTTYTTFSVFPTTAQDGTLAIALDTDVLYVYNSGAAAWLALSAPSAVLSIGPIDSQAAGANGATLNINALIMQSASVTVPGLVNTTVQSFAGNKTFTGTISASNLSGTNTGDVTIGTANGLSIVGQALSLGLSSTSTTGSLSSTDWNTFNAKQPAGNYITDLTGEVTASGPGSVAATISNGVVTNAKMANMANNTVKANKSGISAAPSDLALSDIVETVSSVLTITNGSKSVVSPSNLTIQVSQSTTSTSGYLSSTDWNTFNSKQSSTLTNSHILVGNALNIATDVAMSGDITINNTGVTAIGALKVTNSQIANSTIDLTTKVTGVLPVANGGTNKNSWTASNIVYAGVGGTALTEDATASFTYDETNRRFSVGAPGTGKINATVTSGTDLGLNVFSTGSNNAVQIQNQSAYTVALVNAASSALAGASIGGAFSRGTLAARTQSLAGDQLFSLTSQGYTGTAFGPGFSGAISFVATENTTAIANGGSIVLSTTPNGSLTPVPRLSVGQNGVINVSNLTASLPVQTDASKNLISSAINLASAQVSGVLPVANGGTNSSTALNNNRIMLSSGGAIVESGALSNGQVIIGATGGAPIPATLTAGSGVSIVNAANSITISATGSGGTVTTVGAFNSQVSSANGLVISGANIYAQAATATNPGMVSVPASASGLSLSTAALSVAVDNSTTKINVSNQVEALQPNEERITLSATDITNQFVDLAHVVFGSSASANSVTLSVVGSPVQLKTVDYTVSLTGGTGGVTRITFAGDLATGGAAALIAGDILIIDYSYLA